MDLIVAACVPAPTSRPAVAGTVDPTPSAVGVVGLVVADAPLEAVVGLLPLAPALVRSNNLSFFSWPPVARTSGCFCRGKATALTM